MKKILCMIVSLMIILSVLLYDAPQVVHAYGPNTYWVSPTGTATTWANARHETCPLTLDNQYYASLATANNYVQPGDTVYLRGGTYNGKLEPVRGGTDMDNRIVFSAYDMINEPVTLAHTANYSYGIILGRRSNPVNYVKIYGIKVERANQYFNEERNHTYLLMILFGSSYNEISNCEIDGKGGGILKIYNGVDDIDPYFPPCEHNWIHDTKIHNMGWLGLDTDNEVDDKGFPQIGDKQKDNLSGHNTIENCTFYSNGHHNLETFTKYNVIRNNYFHYEGSVPNLTGVTPAYGPDENNLWGDRNLMISDEFDEDKWNLIEGNRIGHAGPPPDDDGGDGIALVAPANILRFNDIFNSHNNGILMKVGYKSYSDNNRIYNNTIYNSGRYHNAGPQWQGNNVRWFESTPQRVGNVFKNNIFYGHGEGSKDIVPLTGNDIVNNWMTVYGNPMMVSPGSSIYYPDILPDMNLQSGSEAINAGIPLTTAANTAETSSSMLEVDDALYFQDGTWGSVLTHGVTFFPDQIAIGTVDNVVDIISINYVTNEITLDSPMTWNEGDPIWLSRDSAGHDVLNGEAPDLGAHEFSGTQTSAESVNIIQDSISVRADNTGALTAAVFPAAATNRRLQWTTSNPSVATVDTNGITTSAATVSAVSAGVAVITARIIGTTIEDTCIVNVEQCVKVDDTNGSINYGTGWWGPSSDNNYYNNTYHVTNITNKYAQLGFTGTSVAVFVKKNKYGGMFDVYIDGVKDEENGPVDTWGSDQYKVKVYEKTGLSNGSHTIRIQLNSQKNPSSWGYYVYFDNFEYGWPLAACASWKLDDGSGSIAVDSSGNSRMASLYNSPVWQEVPDSISGGCLYFNGTNQYGSAALDLSDTDVVSIAFWMKMNSYSNNDDLAFEFGAGSSGFNSVTTGFMVDPNSSRGDGIKFEVGLRGNGPNSGYNQIVFDRPSTGIWHHYAFVFNKGAGADNEVTAYVDGVPVSYTKHTNNENSNNFGNNTLFMMSRNGTSLFNEGRLDEICIFKRALSLSEISSLATP